MEQPKRKMAPVPRRSLRGSFPLPFCANPSHPWIPARCSATQGSPSAAGISFQTFWRCSPLQRHESGARHLPSLSWRSPPIRPRPLRPLSTAAANQQLAPASPRPSWIELWLCTLSSVYSVESVSSCSVSLDEIPSRHARARSSPRFPARGRTRRAHTCLVAAVVGRQLMRTVRPPGGGTRRSTCHLYHRLSPVELVLGRFAFASPILHAGSTVAMTSSGRTRSCQPIEASEERKKARGRGS